MSLYEDIVTLMESDNDAESTLPSLLVEGILEARLETVLPLERYLDEDRVRGILVDELRVLADRPDVRERIRTVLRNSLRDTDRAQRELRSVLPDAFVESLRKFVTRDYRADPELVRSLVDHPAMRTVMRNVLEETLREFVRRVTEWIRESDTVPGMSGAWSLFTGFFGMAHRYTRRFASKLEERVQQQVDRFTEEMIDEVLTKLVEELCSEEVRDDLSAWRGRALDVVLDRSVRSYLDGLEGSAEDPDETMARFLDELVDSEGFDEFLKSVASLLFRTVERQRVRDVLRVLGLEDAFRGEARNALGAVLFGPNSLNRPGREASSGR